MANYIKRNQFSIGLVSLFFGVTDLWFVIPNMYAGLVGDWPHVDWRFFYFFMPLWSFTVPFLLVLSLFGIFVLSLYCVPGIHTENINNKQVAAIIVTTLGFTYQVVGAWPLWNQWYPWQWQAEIARYGNFLVFTLFVGSLLALLVGAVALYLHSKIWHEKYGL